jgi:excisionase family DNA binding protein
MFDENSKGLWTLQELAEFMRVTIGSARKMVSRGQLPPKAVVRIGARIRIRAAIVMSWLEKGAA